MSDPFETLRHREPAVDRLPAEEVRRLGDRRRRRTALLTGAATLAVLVVLGGTLGSGALLDRTVPAPAGPSPATPPSESAAATPSPEPRDVAPARLDIPADFPLASADPLFGLEESFQDVGACERAVVTTSEPVDEMSVVSSEPEDYRARKLSVYASAEEASAQMTAYLDVFEACPRQEWGDGSPDTVTEVLPSRLGEEAATVVRSAELDGAAVPGIEVVELVRVGNALLLTSESNEGGAGPDGSRPSRAHSSEEAATVVMAMCVFSDAGCVDQPTGVLSLGDVRDVTRFRTSWTQVEVQGRENACQAQPPAVVMERAGPAGLVSDFVGSADAAGIDNARVVSALAVYPDATAAADAFEQARADIDGCVHLGPASSGWDPVEGATASGPTYWQLSTTPAPEVCTECGTAWVHAQGVALVDDRIAAVTISWIGDLEGLVGAEAPGPMAGALERAAEVARAG